MTRKKAAALGKLLNRRTLRILGILGTVLTVSAAVVSALGALLMVRQLQLVSLQRKALPVLERAARLYLDQNGGDREAPSPAGRFLRGRRARPEGDAPFTHPEPKPEEARS